MSEELREELARWLCERRNGVGGWDHEPGRRHWLEHADALLSGPLAPLLAAQAAVERVEALLPRLDREKATSSFPLRFGYEDSANMLRRALDGTP